MELTSLEGPLTSGLIGAFVAVVAKPYADRLYLRRRQTKAYNSHMADRIRDFRESAAVLRSILAANHASADPIATHIMKVAIPDHLVTTKAIDLSDLNATKEREGIELSNLLVNINRDADSILLAIDRGQRESAYIQIDERAKKLINLARIWKEKHPKLKIPAPSDRPKQIFFSDGSKFYGESYSLLLEGRSP